MTKIEDSTVDSCFDRNYIKRRILFASILGSLFLGLMALLIFGYIGWFDWTRTTCDIINCTLHATYSSSEPYAEITFGTVLFNQGQAIPLTNVYDRPGLCNDQIVMPCFVNGNLLWYTRLTMPNYFWLSPILIGLAIGILFSVFSSNDCCHECKL